MTRTDDGRNRTNAANDALAVASVEEEIRGWRMPHNPSGDGDVTSVRRYSIAMLALLLVVAGCRSAPDDEGPLTVRQTSENLIIEQLSSVAGLGDVGAQCPDLIDVTVGATWDCVATTEDQRTVALTAVVNEQGVIDLATTNVITGAAMPSFERAAVAALNTTVQTSLPEDAVDCGETTVVFPVDAAAARTMVCALFDPVTERIFDVTLTIDDIEQRQFSLVVANEPRP